MSKLSMPALAKTKTFRDAIKRSVALRAVTDEEVMDRQAVCITELIHEYENGNITFNKNSYEQFNRLLALHFRDFHKNLPR